MKLPFEFRANSVQLAEQRGVGMLIGSEDSV